MRALPGLAVLAVAFCGCNSINGSVNNQVGMWNYSQGNYQAAREEFYRAVADDPQNATFTYNLACAMKRQGDFAAAEQTYRLSLQTDPSHQPSYHALAALMLEEGRQAEANQVITTWASAQPNNPAAQVEMAWIQRENGDAAGAEQSLYRSLAANPDNPLATARLGQLYQDMGQSDRAAAMFQRSYQGEWLEPQVPRLSEVPSPPAGNGGRPFMFGSNVPTIPFPTANPTRSAVAPPANDDPAHPFN